MNTNGPTTKGLAEFNHLMHDEQKELGDGATGEGQGFSEENESTMLRINEDTEDVTYRRMGFVEAHPVLSRQQPQPQGPQGSVVRWERFLPLRSLKVLLVENDDSTRHVVSALLRNCSYEVMAVANGLEAWKVIEDLSNHIDLVLTEVVMPCLSGIGLLYKIMNHKTFKNIPVIMMSSNDSMGVVFKCLSKGAVDFLVKPIRKNELKNLWQHVWRKCHSSSGSGSESGIRTQKYIKLRSEGGSDNNSGSNDEDDNGSVGFNIRDGSDNGSGTQSSWTKRAVEVDSPKPMSPWQPSADPPDSTCAQVIHLKPDDNWVATTATRECPEQDDELDNSLIGEDLEIGVPTNSDLQLEDPTRKLLTSIAGTNKDKFIDLDSKKDAEKLEKGKAELRSETPNGELRNEAVNLMDAITNNANPQMESLAIVIPKDFSNITNIKDKAIYHKEIPSLELSLKRPRDVGDTGTGLQERNVLRHSDLSAFSRYNTTSTANQAPTGNVGSYPPVDNSSEAAKASDSNGTPNQRSNGSSNNNDMGSTSNNIFNQPEALANNRALPKCTVNLNPSSAFQPIQNGNVSPLQPVIASKSDAARVNTVEERESGTNQQVQVQHHHHHYHHHHHHVHSMQQKQQLSKHDNLDLRNSTGDPHCGPSNGLSTKIEDSAAISSASGSNNGSNGQNRTSGRNGSSAAITTAEGLNPASDNGVAGICGGGSGSGSGSGSRSGVDQNRFGQREAALDKFRQKRKERCFEKKVRYQSRKKLAEQRPRVRGQFVRKVMDDNKNEDSNS